MMREQIIDRLWVQVEPFVFITRMEYEQRLEGWTILTEEMKNKLAFVALINGPEFHMISFGTGAPINRKLIRETLTPILEEHGYVLTQTPKEGFARQHRFNRAFGFHPIGEDEFFIKYRLEASECRL